MLHCRCDAAGMCTEVCARGSVKIEPWLEKAIATQVFLNSLHLAFVMYIRNCRDGICIEMPSQSARELGLCSGRIEHDQLSMAPIRKSQPFNRRCDDVKVHA